MLTEEIIQKKKSKENITFWIILFVGLVIGLLAYPGYQRGGKLSKRGIRSEATVESVRVEEKRTTRNGRSSTSKTHYSMLKYRDAAGLDQKGEISYNGEVGERVKILYLPEEVNKPVLDSFFAIWAPFIFPLGFSSIIVIIALWIRSFNAKRTAELYELLRNGLTKKIRVVGIKESRAGKKNRRTVYSLIGEDEDGNKYTSEIGSIPREDAVGEEVIIKVHYSNSSIYYFPYDG